MAAYIPYFIFSVPVNTKTKKRVISESRSIALPGFRVQGSGFRVQGSGFRVQGSGFRVSSGNSRGRAPPGFQGSTFMVEG